MRLVAPRYRLAALVACLCGLAVLVVWFGTLEPAPALGAYPSTEDLAADYARYVGHQVEVGGTVVATNPVTVEATTSTGRFTATVTGLETPVARGQRLSVFGVARPDRTIVARRVIVVPQSGVWYSYTVSALAGLWVLVRLIGHWRVDRDRWALVPRDRPVTSREIVRQLATRAHGGTRDA